MFRDTERLLYRSAKTLGDAWGYRSPGDVLWGSIRKGNPADDLILAIGWHIRV